MSKFIPSLDFKKLMSARFLFTFAVQVQAIILGWQMYVLTKDALFLGLIGLTEAVPAIGLALFAGYIVDRSKPLNILRMVFNISLLSSILMLVSQYEGFDFSIQTRVVALFAAAFLTGAARAFSQPSMYALIPRIVPRGDLPRSSAWMSTSMQIARISGPAAGGILFGWAGITGASVVTTIVLIAAVAVAFLVKTSPLPAHNKTPGSTRDELLSGARFVFKHPILFPALSLDMFSVLFGGVTALLPIYAAEILFIGPKGLGVLRAAPAVGAAITSLWLTTFDIRKNAGTWLFSSVAGFGFCILVFAISHDFILSLIALGLSGAFDSVSMVVRTSAVQLSSPDAMRGRISAVNSIFISSSNELGEFESGVVARLMGAMPAAIFGGVVCVLTVGITAILSPKLRNLDLDELEREHQATT